MDDAEHQLAELLTRLRRDGERQSGLAPELTPTSAAAAYRVAAEVGKRLSWRVAGWKVAANKPAMQQALRAAEPIMGRVFAPFVHTSPADIEYSRLSHPVVEAELIVRFQADLPPRPSPYTAAEAASAIGAVHVGLEIAECRFLHDDAFPSLNAILADGSGSGHLVIGPAISDWAGRDLSAANVVVYADGRARRTGNVGDAIGHPVETATWLANALSANGPGLRVGDVVSTGTCSGMLLANAGERIEAHFEGLGDVAVTFGG